MMACRVLGTFRTFALALLLAAIARMGVPAGMTSAAGGSTLYVKANASGANNGSSWVDAYTSLQDALDAVTGGGYQIWVAAGTYRPFRGLPLVSDTFQLHNNVSV